MSRPPEVDEQSHVPASKRKVKGKTEISQKRKKRRALKPINVTKTTDKDEKPCKPPFSSNGYQYTGKAGNIDERDARDPLWATDYAQDMYKHFRSKEESTSGRFWRISLILTNTCARFLSIGLLKTFEV